MYTRLDTCVLHELNTGNFREVVRFVRLNYGSSSFSAKSIAVCWSDSQIPKYLMACYDQEGNHVWFNLI
ncbi:hypothetical protein HanRHA438_Chr12g0550591 [Helianthus annuus]|uniref:Uncharacterized protein n=1 Tax=Helianthus annuus TaxID=4232 RepID=A0A251UDL7_HELAN|nr:hypothetical protein HanXRQr2_Chr12g0539731 [Helianthus annuus]KAJ0489268.1 hypothetical protein HanHA300_Chr12g0442071 [Helianthus annuus]KAJ0493013.1 hypothetical protein HanIR_Chr12g0581281 [Helianthus annuus]KAJ0505149.1 hypothetical protein HanHA89_Chr12g0467211 [Helianthus annuus]KAJ0674833.1 hypothetical protein HanLR1_Chr12g0444331 [Helianthus annuus]